MFYGYNDGYMGLAWYEEDLDRQYLEDMEEFDFDYYDACKEQQAEWQAEMDEAMLWDI